MKKIQLLFSIAIILVFAGMHLQCTRNASVADTVVQPILTDTMQYIETFQIQSCDQITLQYYKKMSDARDGVLPAQAVIENKEIIHHVIELLKQLPDEGDMMVKMGDVAILNVILMNNPNPVYFTYYLEHIKTPATSFYSNHPKEEKALHELLMSYIVK